MKTIYVVGTPIGNLKDITFRAVEVLKNVDIILAENTLTTLKLLNHFEIKKPVFRFFQNPTEKQIKEVMGFLSEDKDIAIVSEAGMPGVADPGNLLIKDVLESVKDVKIVPIPGVSAVVSAISISGLNSQEFLFLGFVPKTKQNKFFKKIEDANQMVVFFESPYRIKKTLMKLKELVQSKTNIVICRELTKMFEEIIRTDFENLENDIKNMKEKGEFTIIVC